MSFINPITGNIPNNELIITETNISVENGSFENISAVNASFVNLTTTVFTPVNVNSSQISVSVLNVSTGNMSVLNISTANVSDLIINELELINLSVDNISNDIIDTEVINIKSNNSLLPNGQLRKLNNEVILSLGDAADVGSFSIKPNGTNTELNLTNNVLTGDTADFVNVNAENSITDGLYLNEQSVVLTDQSLIKRDGNQVMFIGKSDAGDVTGADFLFKTGEETGAVKLLIPRTSDIVEMIALYATTTIEGDTGIFNAIGVSDLTVADTTQLGELEVLTSASIKNLNVIGPNGLTAAKGTITNLSSTRSTLTNASIGNLSISGNFNASGTSRFYNLTAEYFQSYITGVFQDMDSVTGNIITFESNNISNNILIKTINLSAVNASISNISSTNISATRITGNISNNLAAGAGINLSTVGGVTTITNTGLVSSPLSVSVINASTINASTINGNISNNLAAGAGINLSTVGGVTTITNTGLVTSPLSVSVINASTINASTMNLSLLNPDEIEGFTKSTQYVFRAIGTQTTGQTLSAGTKIAFNTPVVETPPPVYASGFVDKGFDPVLQQYKVPTPGLYGFGCITYYNNAAYTIKIGIFKNGTLVTSAGNNSSTSDSITTVIDCEDGDWIEVKCVSGGGSTVPAENTFWGYRLEPANNIINSTTNLSVQNLSVADDMSATNLSVSNISTSYLTGINASLSSIYINASAKIAVVNTSQLNASNMSVNLATINSLNAYYSESEYVYFTNNAFGAPGTANAQPGIIFKNLEELQIRSGSVAFPGNIHFTRDGTTTNMIYDGDLNISSKANISNISVFNISATTMTFDTLTASEKCITAVGEIDAVKFNASVVHISNDLTLDPGGAFRVQSLVPGNDFFIYSNSGNMYLQANGTGNLNIGRGSLPDDISITPAGVITVDNLTSTNAITTTNASITNISSTDLTIATSLTGAGNINITGDVSAGIISGATLTGDISGNLTAGDGISLATASGITTIAVAQPYLSLSRTTNYTPGAATFYYYSYNTQLDDGSGTYSYSAGAITVNATGRYVISGSGNIDLITQTDRVALRIRLTVNTVYSSSYPQAYGYARHQNYIPEATACYTDFVINLTAGDVVRNRLDISKGNTTGFNSTFDGINIGAGANCMIRRIS